MSTRKAGTSESTGTIGTVSPRADLEVINS
jgi:hypothetical protein